jgi:hypothetical protein
LRIISIRRAMRVSMAVGVGIAGMGMGQANGQAPRPRVPAPVQPKMTTKESLFKGKNAYVYLNRKTLTWRIGNDAVERTVQFDQETGALKTLNVKTMGGLPSVAVVSSNEGEFTVAADASATPTKLGLDKDWAYSWQSVTTPGHGGRLLTIHLQGIRSHQGYEVEAMYEVMPGNRPYLAKSLTLVNRMESPVMLREIVYDRWTLSTAPGQSVMLPAGAKPGKMSTLLLSGTNPKAKPGAKGQEGGLELFMPDRGEVAAANSALTARYTGEATAAPQGGRAQGPRVVAFPFEGTSLLANTYHSLFDYESHVDVTDRRPDK